MKISQEGNVFDVSSSTLHDAYDYMHIVLDARMMGAGNTRGIGRYIQETVRAVLEVNDALRYTLVVRHLSDSVFVGHPRVEHITADIPWYSVSEQLHMAGILEGLQADLIHIPHWNVPLLLKKPFVITIHDLLLLRQPLSAKISTKNFFIRWTKYSAFRFVIRQAVKRAQKIFVPTRFVAHEVEQLTGVPLSKICVTKEGVTNFPAVDRSLVPSQPFLLYVGSAYPHKRLDILLKAWQELSARHLDYKLVIAGEIDIFMKRIQRQAIQARNGDRIVFTGKVTDAELRGLYESATLFVFPSSHEGFGLPPLEALSLGCPVVASDIESLKEVLPLSGVEWFREGSEHDMIQALERGLSNLAATKQQLSHIRTDICAQHDWRDGAKEVMKGYHTTLDKK